MDFHYTVEETQANKIKISLFNMNMGLCVLREAYKFNFHKIKTYRLTVHKATTFQLWLKVKVKLSLCFFLK